jgi:hypothetical protein
VLWSDLVSSGYAGVNYSELAENSLLSLASDTSLSPTEKEVMFVQIEQCLSKVHRIVRPPRIKVSLSVWIICLIYRWAMTE